MNDEKEPRWNVYAWAVCFALALFAPVALIWLADVGGLL